MATPAQLPRVAACILVLVVVCCLVSPSSSSKINYRIYENRPGLRCCSEHTYMKNSEVCCFDSVMPLSKSLKHDLKRDPELSLSCCKKTLHGGKHKLNVYNPQKQTCCDGKVHDRVGTCCNDVLHDVVDGKCCGKKLLTDGQACLYSIPFDPRHESLCLYNEKAFVIQGAKLFCCFEEASAKDPNAIPSWTPYSWQTDTCCEGVVKKKSSPDAGSCCGQQVYDSSSEICCGGQVYPTTEYNLCCADKAYKRGEYNYCCYGTTPANLDYQECFGGGVRNKSSLYYCKNHLYDTTVDSCCGNNGYILKNVAGADSSCCPPNPKRDTHQKVRPIPSGFGCCGSSLYNLHTKGCCGEKVYKLATRRCCNNKHVVTLKEAKAKNCCDPSLDECCGDKFYNRKTQTCCGGHHSGNYKIYKTIKGHSCCGDEYGRLEDGSHICCST